MSWSYSVGPGGKNELLSQIAAAEPNTSGAASDAIRYAIRAQFEAAKKVIEHLVDALPGPNYRVSISGHANATGDKVPVGWSSDCISVSVAQVSDQVLAKPVPEAAPAPAAPAPEVVPETAPAAPLTPEEQPAPPADPSHSETA